MEVGAAQQLDVGYTAKRAKTATGPARIDPLVLRALIEADDEQQWRHVGPDGKAGCQDAWVTLPTPFTGV